MLFDGTDHTREQVPVLILGAGVKPGPLRKAEIFADIGETIAKHMGIAPGPYGRPLF